MRANSDDAALVADTLGGDREAFGCIVARYQALEWFLQMIQKAAPRISQNELAALEAALKTPESAHTTSKASPSK